MTDPKIMRLETDGPDGAGLEEWEPISPDTLVSGTPVQRGHMYFDDKKTGLSAGVWDCTPMTTKMEPYNVNEFMHVLEGSVTIVHENGAPETIRAGESFVIPKGTPCQWKQSEYIRKFFVIFDDPSGAEAPDPAARRVIRPDPQGALKEAAPGDPAAFVGPVPDIADHTWYEDPTGQFVVGAWEAGPTMERPVGPINRCELMLPVKGSMTLIGDGEETTFAPGQVAFVPKGAPYGWRSTEPVRKIYCAFYQKAAAEAAAAE
jgi:uncharacterized cupin superfamily protein